MSENTGISWADHTFNPWWGCVEVSPACDNCYARVFAKRVGHEVWGADAPRRFFGDKHWNEPRKWNARAKALGIRQSVFCASMADWAEVRPDLDEPRARLWALIDECDQLDWLLLTKRIGVRRLLPPDWLKHPRPHVHYGFTGEDRKWLGLRLGAYLALPTAGKRWISLEPLLGPIDPYRWSLRGLHWCDWFVLGGESGTAPRPMEEAWVRAWLTWTRTHNKAFHLKQAGYQLARQWGCADHFGKVAGEWPEEFRVQEFPWAAAA